MLHLGAQLLAPTLLIVAQLVLIARPTLAADAPAASPFEAAWRFRIDDPKDAQDPAFNDSDWRSVDLPHDWSIEGPFDQKNPTTGSGGWLPAGVGWYRKHFTLEPHERNKRVYIDFDGVMANSDVYLNGQLLGHRPYGYSSFRYDLTPHIKPDGENVLAVRCDNSRQPASRWYSGAGIYRHVRLVVATPAHFQHWSNFVTTPKVEPDRATVRIASTIVNDSDRPRDIFLAAKIFDAEGKIAASGAADKQTIPPGKSASFALELPVEHPKLWDINSPHLYRVPIDVVEAGDVPNVLQTEVVHTGIRSFEFKPDTGFWLNGRNFKLKGVCLHHDGGAFGAAVPLAVWQRRLEQLRELGVNSIRTAHNPPAPEFLDLCDRLGFLVMDETFDCWTVGKNPFDYHLYFNEWSKIDTRDMVLRDRNHASVILYSAGNEIHDTPRQDLAKQILGGLVEVFHANDPTRPVTQALFRPNASGDYHDGLADMLDVVGQNYRENEILAAHEQKPTRKIVGTENRHDLEMWLALRDNPPYAGQFLWTGVDYLGEARRWPNVGSSTGLIDRTAEPRAIGYQRQSWWSDKPMVYMIRRLAPTATGPIDPGYETNPMRRPQVLFADWNPRNAAPHDENVEVYSNCPSVELFLNDKSLGAKPRPANDSPRNWKVPFEPGTLKAVGSDQQGKSITSNELKTAGKPAKIVLSSNREKLPGKWDDVAFVQAMIVDEKGVRVPSADDEITFTVTGPGVVAAVDNADNASHEPFQATHRHAYQGRCTAFLKSTAPSGPITLTASAPDLTPGILTLEATNP